VCPIKKGGDKMYERRGEAPSGKSERECRPDYEEQAKTQTKELDVIKDLYNALVKFLLEIRPYRTEKDGLSGLLGTLQLDIFERERALKYTLEMVEKYK
jgi:hypothetical protein